MMTYQNLYDGSYTAEARKAADDLRYQTEAEKSDVDFVEELDVRSMGGAE